MMEQKHQCEKEGCKAEAMVCHLIDYGDFKSEPKDIYEWLCDEHAYEAGYCPGCGEFWAGCEGFDFEPSHLCPNCKDELESEMEEEEAESWL